MMLLANNPMIIEPNIGCESGLYDAVVNIRTACGGTSVAMPGMDPRAMMAPFANCGDI